MKIIRKELGIPIIWKSDHTHSWEGTKTSSKIVQCDSGSVDAKSQTKWPGIGVRPWRTETPALQPWKSPAHLSNSSPQPRFLVSSLKGFSHVFCFPAQP